MTYEDREAQYMGVPIPIPESPEEEVKEEENDVEDLSDLFEVPAKTDADMRIDDVVAVDEEDVFGEGGSDMSDLLDVDDEDILGEEDAEITEGVPAPPEQIQPSRNVIRRPRRIKRREDNTSTSMGGMRY